MKEKSIPKFQSQPTRVPSSSAKNTRISTSSASIATNSSRRNRSICTLCSVNSTTSHVPIRRHPFHPKHPLILVGERRDCEYVFFDCKACGRRSTDCSYHCADCRFDLHIWCSQSLPALITPDIIHQHPLAIFSPCESWNAYYPWGFKCNSCDEDIGDQAFFFRCAGCEFNLHLDCFPLLPRSAKHKCHRHYLTLTDSPIKDYPDEDDDAEFYCDACEQRRNLYHRSYYCTEPECHFVAHIGCLVYEIICSLEEEFPVTYLNEDIKQDESDIVNEQSDEVTSSAVEEPPLVTSGTVGIEALENPTLAELDDEIVKLRAEMEALAAKLGTLERKRVQLASSSI